VYFTGNGAWRIFSTSFIIVFLLFERFWGIDAEHLSEELGKLHAFPLSLDELLKFIGDHTAMRVAADGEAVLIPVVIDLGKIRVVILSGHSVVDEVHFVAFISDILDDLILFVVTKKKSVAKESEVATSFALGVDQFIIRNHDRISPINCSASYRSLILFP
jgi:hypothetical protein